jgi:uncharacterized protein YyaL (SSP411 family)
MPSNDLESLKATMTWLYQSVVHGRGGSSSHYDLLRGRWLDPFPETTGYIIPTLFDYGSFSAEPRYPDAAIRITDWLGTVQLPNGGCIQGSYREGENKQEAIVFNTGQNIFGFLRTWSETGDTKYLDHAKKAGDLLVQSTDEKGTWNRNLHRGLKHTINTRTSWALLELYLQIPDPSYREVAIANLDWTLEQQTETGWFRHGTSRPGGLPNTHFLSYTCEGLIQSWRHMKDKKYLEGARRTADTLLSIYREKGELYCFWDEQWKNHGRYNPFSKGKFSCLTGNAQISVVWMWLFEETGDRTYLDAACRMIDFIRSTQDLTSRNDGIRGGIKGSHPVYGGYSIFKYPNWAAKFFADALMLKIKLTRHEGTS